MSQALSESVPYTIAISKGSALLNEMKSLLRAWTPGESLKEFSERVVQEDVLGKTTAQRAKDVVRRVFANRFLVPDQAPAKYLHRLLEGNKSGQVFSDLCLLYSSRNDALLRDVIVSVYWPAVAEGQLFISPKEVVQFFRKAEEQGRIPHPWSEPVKIKVARGLLRALAEYGLIREVQRQREIVMYRPADETIVFLAYELHFRGLSDAALVGHGDWNLFGLKERDVIAAMDRLGGEGWWLAQAAGSVVRVSWKYNQMEEVLDALAG